jgi:hypothetical protein
MIAHHVTINLDKKVVILLNHINVIILFIKNVNPINNAKFA